MISLKRIFHSWGRNKLFVTEVILILALGLGANIAIFGVYNTAFLELPFEESGHILTLVETNPSLGEEESFVSAPDLEDWRTAGSGLFDRTALYDSGTGVMTAGGIPERVTLATVSENLFSLLGVRPQLGGLFSSREENSATQDALISDHLWRTTLHSSPDAVGQSIKIGTDLFVVRGVLPPDFRLFDNADVWTRLHPTAEDQDRGSRHFIALARLKKGHSLDQVKAELKAVSQRLQKQFPDTNKGWEAAVMPLRAFLFRAWKSSFTLLSMTALLVLMIAIFNVTNLFGVYLRSTEKDHALEKALGCPETRIRNRLLGEFLLLAVIAGFLGLAVAYAVLKLVMQYAPVALVQAHYLNLSVYSFALAVALMAGLISTLLCFASRSKTNISDVLKGTGKGFGNRLGFRSFPRMFFLIFEVSMCVVLLITAGLLAKSFLLLQNEDPGFNPGNLLTARIQLPDSQYGNPSQQSLFWDQLLTNIARFPGVDGAAAMTGVPLSGSRMTFRFTANTNSDATPVTGLAEYRSISPAAFHLLGVPLRSGRPFLDSDRPDSPPVIVINSTMARNIFPGQDPLGKQLVLWYGDKKPRQIVGIVGDVKYSGLADKVGNQVYVPYSQNPWPFMTVMLHANMSPAGLVPTLRQEVLKLDKQIPLEDVRTMDQIVYLSMARNRFASILIFCFAVLALALAAAGVYGVISFAVSQRSREIAVRIALGATRYSVVRLFLAQSLAILAAGTGLGLLASLFSIRIFRTFLYRVQPLDLQVNLFIILLILAVGILACLFPAGKAASIEPSVVMRSE